MSLRRQTAPRLAAVALTAVLPLGLAACSSSSPASTPSSSTGATSPSDSAPTPTISTPSAAVTPSSAPADQTFGSACSQVPSSGDGSFQEMAEERVATAAEANPLLSKVAAAVKAGGLEDTLNDADDITVFAPADSAFDNISRTDLARLLANRSKIAGILQYHVVKGRLTPADLAGSHQTLNGQSLTVTGSGADFTVDDSAKIICGNVQTANATVYVIDKLLMPS